jgi:hypothetical protein
MVYGFLWNFDSYQWGEGIATEPKRSLPIHCTDQQPNILIEFHRYRSFVDVLF